VELVIQSLQAQLQAMETSLLAVADMATNEARKDLVIDMIRDHEETLIGAIAESKKRESELSVIQSRMSSKQSQVATMTNEYSRLKRGCRAFGLQLWPMVYPD
jgi:hypothetical protein